MIVLRKMVLILLMAFGATVAYAETGMVVQSVQMPAWLTRDGHTQPLAVGIPIKNLDYISTGRNARVLINSPDGSAIKLGALAKMTLSGLSEKPAQTSIFKAFLNIAKGAFRFTTSLANKLKSRQVTIKVANATIGVRGTDVWGKDGDDKRVVVLIEGNITIQDQDNNEFVMDQAMTVYEMPSGQPAKPVLPMDNEKLKIWAMETEMIPGQAVSTVGGKWKVVLLTAPDEQAALKAYDQWRDAGYAVRILPVSTGSGHAYKLYIGQISNRTEATILAKTVRGMMGAIAPSIFQ